MIKNLLAAVGLVVIVRKGYEHFCHYQELKAENERLKTQAENERLKTQAE